MAKEGKQNRLNPRPKVFILPIIFIAASAGFIVFYNYTQQPAKGVQVASKSDTTAKGDSNPMLEVPITGTVDKFKYPGSYRLSSRANTNKTITESYLLVSKPGDLDTRHIGITVRSSAANQTYMDDPAYKFRINPSSGYFAGQKYIGGKEVEDFTKKDGSEVTYFFTSRNYYAVVSASGNGGPIKLNKEAETIVKSWTWLK